MEKMVDCAGPTGEGFFQEITADWKDRRFGATFILMLSIVPISSGVREFLKAGTFDGWVATHLSVALFEIGWSAYAYLRSHKEKIVVSSNAIFWTNWLGSVTIYPTEDVVAGTFFRRIPFFSTRIGPGSRSNDTHRTETKFFAHSVQTKKGPIQWDWTISNLDALNAAVSQLAHQPNGAINGSGH
jgi:hypothetical protein